MQRENLLELVCRRIERLSDLLLAISLALMGIVVVMEVIFRYVIKAPLAWNEELARYLMIWLTFIGGNVGIRRGTHVGAEGLKAFVSPRARKWVVLASNSIIMIFLVLLLKYGWLHALSVWPQLSAMMRISMFWVYIAIPLGALLMIVQLANVMLQQLFDGAKKA